MNRSDRPPLDAGEYYWSDLVGMSVHTTNGECLGTIQHIFPTGSNDVYVVRDGSRETLVPALAWVVVKVDVEAKAMTVDLPEGL
jgi:16S rRNA processing protein RimM